MPELRGLVPLMGHAPPLSRQEERLRRRREERRRRLYKSIIQPYVDMAESLTDFFVVFARILDRIIAWPLRFAQAYDEIARVESKQVGLCICGAPVDHDAGSHTPVLAAAPWVPADVEPMDERYDWPDGPLGWPVARGSQVERSFTGHALLPDGEWYSVDQLEEPIFAAGGLVKIMK